MRFIQARGALILAALSLFSPRIQAEEAPNGSELSLPWAQFEKLLRLNRDDIMLSWDEFQKLIKQTGVQETPNFQVQNGNVVLSREEFKKLLERMKAPPSETPKSFLTKAVYSGTVGSESTIIKAQIRLQIPGKNAEIEPLRIQLFPGSMAFQEILLDGQPALIENDGGWMYLTTTKSGDHLITAKFSTPSSLKKPPYQLNFSVPRTPITQVEITIPIRNLDIKVTNASDNQLIQVDGGTQVKATLPIQDSIYLTWNPVTPETEKGPAKIYADVYNLLRIEEDALRVQAFLDLDVIQNTVNSINIKVPHGYNVLEVEGEGVGEWKVQGEEDKVLVVPLQFARRGKYGLRITAELLFKEKSAVANYDGFQVLKAVREKGFVGVELQTTAEAKTVDVKGLDRVDTQELPPSLLNLASRPLLFGFKYLRQPYSFNLDIQRHEEVAVISTVVDEANGVTLVLEDGKRVHHITFTVRNTWKQFLELKLPFGAQVWSAFVEGQRVKPSKNAEGRVLIPLNRSKAVNNDLTSFDVEIMYYEGTGNMLPIGSQKLEFPAPDVVVSQMIWSVYLPVNFDYLYFGGTVDKEKQATGISPIVSVLKGGQRALNYMEQESYSDLYRQSGSAGGMGGRKERAAKLKSSRAWSQRGSFSEAQGVDEDLYAKQVEREFNFFNQVKEQSLQQADAPSGEVGVLPIRVKVPNAGKVFRFSKQILVDQSPLRLTVFYLGHWLIQFIMLLIIGISGYVIYRLRSHLRVTIQRGKSFLHENQAAFQWIRSPMGSLVSSFVAMILFSLVSRFLFILGLLMFLSTTVRFFWIRFEAKRREL